MPFWIRVHPGKPMVRLFGFVVSSVRNPRQARIEVGLLNQRQDYLKFTLRDGIITATYDLPASPFVSELLLSMVLLFSEQVDELAADTAVRVGGKLWLHDPESPSRS